MDLWLAFVAAGGTAMASPSAEAAAHRRARDAALRQLALADTHNAQGERLFGKEGMAQLLGVALHLPEVLVEE